ncbi:MAG: 4-hydroxy-4-methyl-2-oxoglutarate aldolase/4-carboxy-4-hydroxy-2-oxoadipate aldolase [Herbaspirillum frisingense]|uniref:Putative 4-hydroxy-4-methyl-2-oxoglutarate aldolase n=1 Tax=Herbaspirillum frisingense TaxID=92645 RepID=A0A7V8JU18_9BURK|nr:MAG: 4-hydroxy-4-methyl-2-oxoglutarate aldolase/4-carboxy-4-hydroxy-2-oxoadipate aldolase [Herbaspirillum frisingense]
MNAPGWRRNPSAPSVNPALLEQLRGLAVSLLSDNMARVSGAVGLQPYHRGGAMAGTAVTVRTRPGDNLAIHRAFDFCRPGDVLVIDGGGELTQALLGDIMASYAQSIGVAGLVVDGAIRDVAELRTRDFPVYARGVTHRGPYKNGPGEVNVPVTVGGMVVHPGDIVVGDEDGVLAIAPGDAEQVIAGAKRQFDKEAAALRSIVEGKFDRGWIDEQERRMMGG